MHTVSAPGVAAAATAAVHSSCLQLLLIIITPVAAKFSVFISLQALITLPTGQQQLLSDNHSTHTAQPASCKHTQAAHATAATHSAVC
jgi:hypothetical protein